MFRYEYYCGGANNDEIAALSFGVKKSQKLV